MFCTVLIIFNDMNPGYRMYKRKIGHGVFKYLILTVLLLSVAGCIEQFTPATGEDKNLIAVEGLITDQPGQNFIKLSTSQPLGLRSVAKPLSGCIVNISDDEGNTYYLNESDAGNYVADPDFHGIIGRSYTLHIKSSEARHNLSYESSPVLLRPVPPIDSIYYEKHVYGTSEGGFPTQEGCDIYLNTHDPTNLCKFFRWEYTETWQFQLPYYVPNKVCWTSSESRNIAVKSTSSLSEDKIVKQLVNAVDNNSDRLSVKYSILVSQYSINEDEFTYWDKLNQVVEQVGSLYDITPASIPSNIRCIEKPEENVLGYFSVSSVKSKRLFIKNQFMGLINLYNNCESLRIGYYDKIPNLNIDRWVIIDQLMPPPPFKVLTFFKGCADCTVRGTTAKPDFWIDDY